MKYRQHFWKLCGPATLGLIAVLAAPGLRADDAQPPQAAAPAQIAAPAARAVRLSSVEGNVQLAQGAQPATQALANTPLFEGTQLTTGDDGRAEVQFEDGSVVRLSPNSSLTITVLQMHGATPETETVLTGGLGYFEFSGAGKMRIRFGGDAVVTPAGATILRLNVDTPPGALAVFSGNAHLERGSSVMVDLHGGESVTLNASDATQYNLSESIEPDSWDAWNSDRDEALSAEASANTGAANNYAADSGDAGDVAPDNPAWNDLDANGSWYNVPGEGYIWSPYDASSAGFDPYGCGNWVWTPGYGYVWVSCYSWGYLPFQCGGWSYYGGFGWGWAPAGCHPWWGGGFWFSTLRIGPRGYRPPLRPRLPGRGGPTGPLPVIPYHRAVTAAGVSSLPLRNRNTPVTIGGQTVVPLRPLVRRPMYTGATVASGVRAGTGMTARPGYAGGRATVWPAHSADNGSGAYNYGTPRTGYRSAPGATGGATPATRAAGGSRPAAPAPRASSGGRTAPAPSHASSGGGHAAGGATHR